MLNIEKYEKEIIDIGLNSFGCTKDNEIKRCADIHCCDCVFCDNRRCSSRKTIEWLASEYKEPILNEKEKEILNKLIEANRVIVNINLVYVKKVNILHDDNKCYLCFSFENSNESYTVTFNKDCIFTGMEVNKEYSLEDLGLC